MDKERLSHSAGRGFAHVFRNGKHESICLSCFLTTGSARTESDLEAQDQAHACNPTRVLLGRRKTAQPEP